MACAPSQVTAGRPTRVKVGKVASISGVGPQTQRSVDTVLEMLRQCSYDEACVFLHRLNQDHIEQWSLASKELLNKVDSSKFSILATIVKCSAKTELSACNLLIPGLSKHTQKLAK